MTAIPNITALLEKISQAHVICVGDIILDTFVQGTVSRISPEAPVPILLEKRRSSVLGGVGNVARNIAAFNGMCHVLGVIGQDQEGEKITSLFKELEGVQVSTIQSLLRPTTKKIRYLSQGGAQVLRVDRESSEPIADQNTASLFKVFKEALKRDSVVILSDYKKGVLTSTLTRQIIDHARSLGAFIAVDPKQDDFRYYAGASLIKPNLRELSQATGLPVESDEQVRDAAQHLLKTYDFQAVLVTRSEKGMSLITADASPFHIPTKAQEVYDVSGAGDTVMAIMMLAKAAGRSLEEAASLANVAAGIVVGKVGTAVTTSQEVLDAMEGDKLQEKTSMTWEQVENQVTLWHRSNLKVGFTNGCFDLLHPGHVHILREARACCDRLVVGLNSDRSVKRLKGDERPVQSQEARALVLQALEYVDGVVVFDQDTPKDLIEVIRPDVLIKGADYTADRVVGADFVKSYGGEVKLISLVPDQSTTQTIEKMKIF